MLAWLRLLADPRDAAAVVRALTRPPIDLRQADLARVIQIARRRKLNLVEGLEAAGESPQVPAEARERITRFLELHRSLAAQARRVAPELLLGQIADALGTRPPGLSPERAGGDVDLLRSAAREYATSKPDATLTELAADLDAVERGTPPASGPSGAADTPEALMAALREELLGEVASLGAQLHELRLDTELDIAHGVVRYLELVKLSAVLQRPEGQSVADALADANSRLQVAATALQREILASSGLDEMLLGADNAPLERSRRSRDERTLGPFLPRRGGGLALSASDIQTYRSCPLRYKYARVLRIPTAQTVAQRFGIVVHQVLERYHSERSSTLEELLALLDSSWRRSALGDDEGELLERGREALRRYHERLASDPAEPLWFERPFAFRVGPHQVRGRVDRVDRVAIDGQEGYELIDYKTSRAKTAEQLGEDVQLSLYALAAREAWQLETSRQAYYYVLDDKKTAVPRAASEAEAVTELVLDAGAGILAERFEPTPSPAACGICDYRIICPAAEA